MIVLISIALALIALWVIGQISNKEDLSMTSVIILIFWGFFGFGFWACTYTKYTKEEKSYSDRSVKRQTCSCSFNCM